MDFTNFTNAKRITKLSYLGNINSSAKIIKNKKVSNNYTYILYLAPYMKSGYNVCRFSTEECRIGCLATSGRAGIDIIAGKNIIHNARINKTKLFHEDNNFFMEWLIAEMKRYQKKAKKDGYDFSVRLNGTSDIDWANVKYYNRNIFEIFPNVQFYDYTKDFAKVINNRYPNYHLTFSYSGKNTYHALTLLRSKKNVAIVFNTKKNHPLPKTFMGYEVIDGDLTDFRPNDGEGVIVGLRYKKIANKENESHIRNSVFLVQPNNPQCTYL